MPRLQEDQSCLGLCVLAFVFWHAGKNRPTGHCSCGRRGREQGATNVAFPPPLEGTIVGAGGRNGKDVVKKSTFCAFLRKFMKLFPVFGPGHPQGEKIVLYSNRGERAL